jgi:hypothetical protein
MRSRGFLYALGAGTRKGFALFWTALLLCSLLLQYVAFTAPASVLAVHDIGVFELDGNAVDQANTDGDDWRTHARRRRHAVHPGSVEKDAGRHVLHRRRLQDENDITAWNYTSTDVAPDKDELLDVFASVYQHSGDTVVYFGADKFDDSGDAQIGFWFFRRNVSLSGGNFVTNPAGGHTNGDVLILSDFTNGGNIDRICVYEWDGSSGGTSAINNSAECDLGNNLVLVASGADCQLNGDGAFDVCADVNDDEETAPWAFENKDGDDFFGPGQFYEGGINLSCCSTASRRASTRSWPRPAPPRRPTPSSRTSPGLARHLRAARPRDRGEQAQRRLRRHGHRHRHPVRQPRPGRGQDQVLPVRPVRHLPGVRRRQGRAGRWRGRHRQ